MQKIPAARKFPFPTPHNFSNGPSLTGTSLKFLIGMHNLQIKFITWQQTIETDTKILTC